MLICAEQGLASVYGVSTFTTPYTTSNGAVISGGKVGGNGTCAAAYRVYLNAGSFSLLISGRQCQPLV